MIPSDDEDQENQQSPHVEISQVALPTQNVAKEDFIELDSPALLREKYPKFQPKNPAIASGNLGNVMKFLADSETSFLELKHRLESYTKDQHGILQLDAENYVKTDIQHPKSLFLEEAGYGKAKLKNLSPDLAEEFSETNNSSHNFIFFQKIKKTGSLSLKYLFQEMQEINKFQLAEIKPDKKLKGQYPGTADYLAEIKKASSSDNLLVLMEQNYMNFQDFSEILPETPKLITMVRNPIDRFISNYYFCRFGNKFNKNTTAPSCQNLASEELNQPVEDYLKTNTPGKSDVNFVSQFCHSAPPGLIKNLDKHDRKFKNYPKILGSNYQNCLFKSGDVAGMEQVYFYVKKLIMEEYLMVGVYEEFDKSLELLEKFLPEYFEGLKMARSMSAVNHRLKFIQTETASNNKTDISKKLRQELETSLTFSYDMDLYRFMHARLMTQYFNLIKGEDVFGRALVEDHSIDLMSDSKELQGYRPSLVPRNPNFVFHNKMPKAGSSTIKD